MCDLPRQPCEVIRRLAETKTLQVVAKGNEIKDKNVHNVATRTKVELGRKGQELYDLLTLQHYKINKRNP